MNDSVNDCGKRKRLVSAMMLFNGTVFLASACIMIMEIAAGRIVSRYIGQSLYTWTSVIGVVLAGISIGNYIGGRLADRFEARRTVAWLFLVSSILCLTIPAINYGASRWLFLLERDWPVRIILHVMMTFILPSCALGMISPVVAKMALDCGAKVGRTIGNIYAWGACGSIVGTFLAGFYLIAVMGILKLLVVIAVVLALMAAAYSRGSRSFCLYLLFTGVMLFGAVSNTEDGKRIGRYMYLRDPLENDARCVYRDESQYSHIAVMCVEDMETYRSMILDKLTHSKMDVSNPLRLKYEYLWVYESVIDKCLGKDCPISVLTIGGGGYAFPQYLEKARPGSNLHVAEIDPAVTKAAFTAFGLNADTAIKIHDMDARNYIDDLIKMMDSGRETMKFDCILGDSINHYNVPYHLTTLEFAGNLARLLKPEGLYMLNLVDMYEPGLFLGAIVRTLGHVFPYVSVFSATGILDARDTFVVVASMTEYDMSDVDGMIRAKHSKYKGLLLSGEHMAALKRRGDGIILTDDFAPVEQLLACVVRSDYTDLFTRYVTLGSQELDAGRYERAEEIFTRMMKKARDDMSDPYFNLGEVYDRKQDYNKAMDYFQYALTKDPGSSSIRNRIAELITRQGDVDGGKSLWLEILEDAPYNVDANNNMGLVLAYNGMLDEAMTHWRKVLKVRPSDPLAHYQLGMALSKKGFGMDASYHIKKARELDPELTSVTKDFLPAHDDAGSADIVERLLF